MPPWVTHTESPLPSCSGLPPPEHGPSPLVGCPLALARAVRLWEQQGEDARGPCVELRALNIPHLEVSPCMVPGDAWPAPLVAAQLSWGPLPLAEALLPYPTHPHQSSASLTLIPIAVPRGRWLALRVLEGALLGADPGGGPRGRQWMMWRRVAGEQKTWKCRSTLRGWVQVRKASQAGHPNGSARWACLGSVHVAEDRRCRAHPAALGHTGPSLQRLLPGGGPGLPCLPLHRLPRTPQPASSPPGKGTCIPTSSLRVWPGPALSQFSDPSTALASVSQLRNPLWPISALPPCPVCRGLTQGPGCSWAGTSPPGQSPSMHHPAESMGRTGCCHRPEGPGPCPRQTLLTDSSPPSCPGGHVGPSSRKDTGPLSCRPRQQMSPAWRRGRVSVPRNSLRKCRCCVLGADSISSVNIGQTSFTCALRVWLSRCAVQESERNQVT